MYFRKNENTLYCGMHNQMLCTFICCSQTCHKNGLICKDCINLEMHKKHVTFIYPVLQAITYMRQCIVEDNLNPRIRDIQEVQESISNVILFFRENNIPQLFSLEKNLVELKENFWSSLLKTSTRNIFIIMKEMEAQNEEESIKNFIALLSSCSLYASEVFSTDFKWYFDQAIQMIIEEFRDILRPYNGLLTTLNTKKLINKDTTSRLCDHLAKVSF